MCVQTNISHKQSGVPRRLTAWTDSNTTEKFYQEIINSKHNQYDRGDVFKTKRRKQELCV